MSGHELVGDESMCFAFCVIKADDGIWQDIKSVLWDVPFV